MTPHDAPTHEAPPLQHLQELVAHLSEHAGHPDISWRRGISESTVRSHCKAIFKRLGLDERAYGVQPALME
jgi:DNA-binding CsgD family transcriptional regulator